MTVHDAAAWAPPRALAGLARRAFLVGGVAAAVCAVGGFLQPEQFFRSYLPGFLLWLGVALGCLGIAMLHHMSRGAWGLVIRRPLEAAAGTLPVLALLFLPIAFGTGRLYLWAQPAAVAHDELLQHKAAYLNVPFFLLRAAVYFALWIGLAFVLNALSRRQDETGDPRLFRRLQMVAAPGLAIYCLTATFASIDWLMSLDPHWFSSLFGVYFVGGHGLAALGFVIPTAVWLSRRPPLQGVLAPRHLHDHGKLLLAFVMLWAYFLVSQYLIIWSGNLPEEVTWFLRRSRGGWQFVSAGLVLLQFVFPFLLLLSRDLKRSARLLAGVGLLVLAMRWVDLFWQSAPTFHPEGLRLHWLDLATPIAVGGLWLGAFFTALARRPLLPLHDPYLDEALRDEHA
jgi:hypothetical protein